MKKRIEKFLINYPVIYRFISRRKKNSNPDKYIFSKLIKKGETVIDCGANIGYYTNFFRSIVGKNGYVHSFEPVPTTFKQLQKNTKNHSTDKNYTLNMYGLYNKNTEKRIYIPDSISGHASLNNHSKVWNTNKIEDQKIKLVKLDNYVEKKVIGKIDFIKFDIEGSEIEALKGSELTIKKYKPRLHVEVNNELLETSNNSVHELSNLLKVLGYKNVYYYDENPELLLDFKTLISKEFCINTNIIAVS